MAVETLISAVKTWASRSFASKQSTAAELSEIRSDVESVKQAGSQSAFIVNATQYGDVVAIDKPYDEIKEAVLGGREVSLRLITDYGGGDVLRSDYILTQGDQVECWFDRCYVIGGMATFDHININRSGKVTRNTRNVSVSS